MSKLTAILAAVACLAMAGCESKDEAATRISKKLPQGCELIDLGNYPGIDTLVVIKCNEASTTTSASWTRYVGKAVQHPQYAIFTPAGRQALEAREGENE